MSSSQIVQARRLIDKVALGQVFLLALLFFDTNYNWASAIYSSLMRSVTAGCTTKGLSVTTLLQLVQ
jgi:hypothetical protein